MKAFHNDPAIKEKYVARVKAHAEADEIVKGKYWENGKGCAVGCTIEGSDHARYETELGIPEWLARLEDTLFENIPNEEAMKFPLRFLEAIPVGANLEPVKWKFCAYLLNENIERVLTLEIADDLKEQVVSAIRQTLAVYHNHGVLADFEAAAWLGWDKSEVSARRNDLMLKDHEGHCTGRGTVIEYGTTVNPRTGKEVNRYKLNLGQQPSLI